MSDVMDIVRSEYRDDAEALGHLYEELKRRGYTSDAWAQTFFDEREQLRIFYTESFVEEGPVRGALQHLFGAHVLQSRLPRNRTPEHIMPLAWGMSWQMLSFASRYMSHQSSSRFERFDPHEMVTLGNEPLRKRLEAVATIAKHFAREFQAVFAQTRVETAPHASIPDGHFAYWSVWGARVVAPQLDSGTPIFDTAEAAAAHGEAQRQTLLHYSLLAEQAS